MCGKKVDGESEATRSNCAAQEMRHESVPHAKECVSHRSSSSACVARPVPSFLYGFTGGSHAGTTLPSIGSSCGETPARKHRSSSAGNRPAINLLNPVARSLRDLSGLIAITRRRRRRRNPAIKGWCSESSRYLEASPHLSDLRGNCPKVLRRHILPKWRCV